MGRGEIVALLGENGAGKSTLIKVLGGIHTADAGRVLIDGAPYQHKPAGVGERQKVAFIHQDLGLIEWMTVAENIGLALGFSRRNGLIRWSDVERFAVEALRKVDAEFDPTTRVEDLTRTEKSLVAIARALAVDSEFLVLDEPTASLPADEVERLFAAIRPLAILSYQTRSGPLCRLVCQPFAGSCLAPLVQGSRCLRLLAPCLGMTACATAPARQPLFRHNGISLGPTGSKGWMTSVQNTTVLGLRNAALCEGSDHFALDPQAIDASDSGPACPCGHRHRMWPKTQADRLSPEQGARQGTAA